MNARPTSTIDSANISQQNQVLSLNHQHEHTYQRHRPWREQQYKTLEGIRRSTWRERTTASPFGMASYIPLYTPKCTAPRANTWKGIHRYHLAVAHLADVVTSVELPPLCTFRSTLYAQSRQSHTCGEICLQRLCGYTQAFTVFEAITRAIQRCTPLLREHRTCMDLPALDHRL